MIAIPIALQNLISLSTNLIDTLMLGQADQTGVFLSGSALANQVFFLLSLICFGLSGAATVLSAQYWGKRDTQAIRTVVAMILQVTLCISLVFSVCAVSMPSQIMRLFSNNQQIVEAGATYLRIIGFTYIFFGLSNTMICMLRCVEVVRISVVVNLISLCTNLLFNWLLIFGNGGFPKMGIQGAAIATLIARLVEFTIIFIYVFFVDKTLCFRPRHLKLLDKILFRDLFRFGGPVLINEICWALGITIQASIMGYIEYAQGDPVGAQAIASIVQQLSTTIIFGIANAAAVIIGKTIGEKSYDDARLQAKTLRFIGYFVGFFACIFILLTRDYVIAFYDVPLQTKLLAREMLSVIAVITFFVATAAIAIVGILRGAADTKYCLHIELISLWLIALPLAFLASKVFLWPVPIVLLCMKLDEPVKAVLCIARMRSGKWIKIVTREKDDIIPIQG